jgi:PilZ domain
VTTHVRVAGVTVTSRPAAAAPMGNLCGAGCGLEDEGGHSSMIMFKRSESRAVGQLRFGDRRKSERQTAGWESRYRVVDEEREHLHYAGDDYERCVVTDLSMDGAGIHVTSGDVAVGDRVELQVPLGAHQRASIRVRGEVVRASSGEPAPRTELAFVKVGDLERALLHRLLRDMKSPASKSA